jgi:hypothetical protein
MGALGIFNEDNRLTTLMVYRINLPKLFALVMEN